MKNVFILAVLSLVLFSCGSDNKELLVGKWREIETGTALQEFKADGTYTVKYDDGTAEEKGTWRVKGDELFTKEEGGDEYPSQIATLDDENLAIQVSGFGMTLETKYKREK